MMMSVRRLRGGYMCEEWWGVGELNVNNVCFLTVGL